MSRIARQQTRRGMLPPPLEIMQKLEKSVDEGDAYGALQLYKTYSARYAAAEKFNEALDLIEAGAIIQFKHCEVISGAELATLFVETLVKGKFPFSEDSLDRIRKIYQAFPKLSMPQHLTDQDDDDMEKLSEALVAAKTRVEVCSSFLKSAIRWSADNGASKNGFPELHYMLAEYIYSESPELDMTKVTVHFVRGNNPKKFASTLANFMEKCYPGEDDLAIARAVLMYLSQGNLGDANTLMVELRKQLELKQQTLPKSDLIQFVIYLLETAAAPESQRCSAQNLEMGADYLLFQRYSARTPALQCSNFRDAGIIFRIAAPRQIVGKRCFASFQNVKTEI